MVDGHFSALGGKRLVVATDLGDAWVGALHVPAGQVEPARGVGVDGGAVVAQRAPPLLAAPAALELPVRLQAQAAAVPLGGALVQVHCGGERMETLSRLC